MKRYKLVLALWVTSGLLGCQPKDKVAQKEKMQNRMDKAIDEQYHQKRITEIEDLYEEKNKDLEEKFHQEKKALEDKYDDLLPSSSPESRESSESRENLEEKLIPKQEP